MFLNDGAISSHITTPVKLSAGLGQHFVVSHICQPLHDDNPPEEPLQK